MNRRQMLQSLGLIPVFGVIPAATAVAAVPVVDEEITAEALRRYAAERFVGVDCLPVGANLEANDYEWRSLANETFRRGARTVGDVRAVVDEYLPKVLRLGVKLSEEMGHSNKQYYNHVGLIRVSFQVKDGLYDHGVYQHI